MLAAFGLFRNGALPQFEAITLTHLDGQTYRYTRVRLWGSVGFSFLSGQARDALGAQWTWLGAALVSATALLIARRWIVDAEERRLAAAWS